jgi:Raf kinase inhibitor-like YbhB/YbcL family protein
MKIISSAMNGGTIPEKYGKFSNVKNEYGIPNLSVPFAVEDAPEGTVSYALVLDDVDAVPVCGFVWIHWVAADIMDTAVPEGATAKADFVQGVNSLVGSNGKDGAFGYAGMAPPDAPHTYTLRVYALDCKLGLSDGFYYNELVHAMKGHILAVAEAEGIYNN